MALGLPLLAMGLLSSGGESRAPFMSSRCEAEEMEGVRVNEVTVQSGGGRHVEMLRGQQETH